MLKRKTKVKVLKAHHGDSIIIETKDLAGNNFTVLVDGGPRETFKSPLISELKKYEKIDLVFLTHIDHDHINGLLQFFDSSYSKKIIVDILLFNAPNLLKLSNNKKQISADEGTDFEKVIANRHPDIKVISEITSDNVALNLPDGIEINIVSPNKTALEALVNNWKEVDLTKRVDETQISISTSKAKDYEVNFNDLAKRKDKEKSIKSDYVNASSIAFTIKTNNFHGLFMGDAHSTIVAEGIAKAYNYQLPVQFDLIKISHHGSKNNTSNKFLECINCKNYVISTDGGKGRSKHPDRQTIAKIVKNCIKTGVKPNIYFNYPLSKIEKKTGKLFSDEELTLFHYEHKNEFLYE